MARYNLGGGTVTVKNGNVVVVVGPVAWGRTKHWRKDTILIPTPTREQLGEAIAEAPVQEKLC